MRLKLGEATTNTQGIAVYEYTGTGAGELQIKAKAGNLLSETYSVLDVLFYDKAVTGHKNENTYYNANCEETVEDTGTIVAYKGSGAYLQYKFGQTTSSAKPFSIGTAIEFDIVDTNGMSVLFVGNSNYARQAPQVACNMKITITSEHITWYQDNTQIAQVQTSNYISDNFSVGFTTNGSGKYIKYKEMKIYPIESEEPTPVEPVVTSLTLSNTKDILSAYDSESTTLTATVKDQNGSVMSGQTVVFKKGSSTLDTVQTNSSGVATYTYTADGSGDVVFTTECMNLQETYEIEDNVLYRETLSSSTLNINLPSNFEMSWKVHRTNGSTNADGISQPQLQDSTHNYFIGQYGSLGQCGFIIRNQGSSSNLVIKTLSSNLPNNTDETIVYSFNNGVHTCSVDGIGSVSDTNSYVPTKLYNVSVGSQNIMHEFKLKPL